MKEFKDPKDYFPYIEHDLNHNKIQDSFLWQSTVGMLFKNVHDSIEEVRKNNRNEITITNDNNTSIFFKTTVNGLKKQLEISKDPDAAEVLVPRHRSLYDYIIGMPVHYYIINPELMILAGQNLLVSKYASSLKNHGAIAFIREDTYLKRKGYPKTFISMKKYLNEIFPEYLKQEMITGSGENRIKRDLIIYPGQEKDPNTNIRSGGRSKSGKLRKLNPVFFQKFNVITDKNISKLFVTPVNISFSKYPDAPFIVHPGKKKGMLKNLRYLKEQNFIFKSYSAYCRQNSYAKLEVIVNYGEPHHFSERDFKAMRDVIHFSNDIREEIGKLESIFPLTLIYRAMDTDSDVLLSELDTRIKKLYENYKKIGINCKPVSDINGNIKPVEELAETAMKTINANPPFQIKTLNKMIFLKLDSGRIYSNDRQLHNWYANGIRHLDPD
jgi:hypothetical protein